LLASLMKTAGVALKFPFWNSYRSLDHFPLNPYPSIFLPTPTL